MSALIPIRTTNDKIKVLYSFFLWKVLNSFIAIGYERALVMGQLKNDTSSSTLKWDMLSLNIDSKHTTQY